VGRHNCPLGATYRFVGKREPPPALKPSAGGETIELDRPNLELLARTDPSLAAVQEQRRSIRKYSPRPVTLRQLGEFLYRVERVKALESRKLQISSEQSIAMEFASRPYPGGGALHELELYIAVNACQDLSPGLYHYEPLCHRLERVAGPTSDVDQLLGDAAAAAGMTAAEVQVVIILATRLERLAYKYESIAYALTLKNVGVIYQTMYLVATAMGLAPCGVGAGDSDCFARAIGTDYYAETSVGEFLLGSRPEEK
jgi:SagB-type dehydrogenase family enzyme